MIKGNIFEGRIRKLNGQEPVDGKFVLYWMQQSQRAEYNHALEYAIERANEMKLPVVAIFGLTAKYPEANVRHYAFMTEGLGETIQALEKRGVKLIVRKGEPADKALEASQQAAFLVCDRGYTRHQKNWRQKIARNAPCPAVQIESDVIVPVGTVSNKAEFAARTIRPKIHRHLEKYLAPVPEIALERDSLDFRDNGIDLESASSVLELFNIDPEPAPVSPLFHGGTSHAKKRFETFVRDGLERYDKNGNQPQTDDISHMSHYLHFGQISPLYLALEIKKCKAPDAAKEAYLEQLIVRRELAANYVEYTPDYDRFAALPEWALKTLEDHKKDERPAVYTRKRMENAETNDEYWNAAMREMKCTGFMHNYMRMYWGKKILEWCGTPEYAFRTALYLNNKYFLDGRDPNSYAGVAWVFGLHDRPFKERAVFGKVRYMSASGLERKFGVQAYINKVEDRRKSMKQVA